MKASHCIIMQKNSSASPEASIKYKKLMPTAFLFQILQDLSSPHT